MKIKISKKIAVILTLALIFGFGSAAMAASVIPDVVYGNPDCTCGDYSFKIDADPATGSYTDPGSGGGTFTIIKTDAVTFDWSTDYPVCAVIVKGGPNANVYSYSPPAFGDTGLHPPINPENGQPYGISHVTFCYYEPVPAIHIEKHTCGDDHDTPTGPKILFGADVPWTYYVTIGEGGNVPLSNVQVTDDHDGVVPTYVGGDDNGNNKLDLTETWIYTATGTAVAGQYENLGTATGDFGVVTVSDEDPSHYIGVVAEITIVKIIDCADGDELTLLPNKPITWQYTVTNTGDVPLSDVVVTDSDPGLTLVRVSGDGEVLDPGEIWVYEASGITGTDPYVNTGTATGNGTDDCDNIVEVDAEDTSSYDVANPGIDIEKITCDDGDGLTLLPNSPITWQYTVTNTGDVPLSNVVVTDSDLGVIAGPPSGDTNSDGKLDPSETWVYEASGETGTEPYENTGTATGEYTDDCGYSDDVSATDISSYSIAAPSFTVSKVCDSSPVPQEGPAVFTVVFSNDGNVDLTITANEGIGTFSLEVGETKEVEVTVPGPFTTDPPTETVDNTVEATATYIDHCGNQWLHTQLAEATCGVAGRVNVLKLTQGQVDPSKDWTFEIYEVGVAIALESDNTFNDDDGILDFDGLNLDPTKTYILMEVEVLAGWTSFWQIDAGCDGIGEDIITPYNPNASDDPPADLGNRAINIGADTPYPIPAGGTLCFVVDNTSPGGDARTPGYWKNWNTVTGGGQAATAEKNGGWEEGFWLLDDVLNFGITIGILELTGEDLGVAVSILDQRDIVSGKKMARDAAYTLAMHLLAYECNRTAGAYISSLASDAAIEAQILLASIGFDGTGNYLSSKHPLYEDALGLAEILDSYNNNELQ